ncbi:MAG: hypothetical protein MI723_16670 [Caulobacterales bacterium]|nr:hypothetical protein [Caulobacterales bacterium]
MAGKSHANNSPARSEIELAELGAILHQAGLMRPRGDELPQLHRLAARLFGDGIAILNEVNKIDAHTGNSVWVYRENGAVTGINSMLPLSPWGHELLLIGNLDPQSAALDCLTAPGETCAAIYCWGYGGTTPRARAAVVRASMRLREGLFAPVPVYARAATPDGRRTMERMGYVDVPDALPDLMVSAPRVSSTPELLAA